MILSGVILLLGFGLPFRVRTGRQPVSSSRDHPRWYTFLGWFGLALIVFGALAQIEATFF
jgi:Mn2+/Fe2+ NRAMP family transporter